MSWNKSINRLLRNWHRDIGYFVVAISLVYGLSGILLTHKEAFPVISTLETRDTLQTGLDIASFSQQWTHSYPDMELSKCFKNNENIRFYFDGGKGSYEAANGCVAFENYKKHHFTAFLTDLHFNQKKGWKYFADFFSICLIFLAISGLFMVKGKNGLRKRGIWIMLAGIILVVVFAWIN